MRCQLHREGSHQASLGGGEALETHEGVFIQGTEKAIEKLGSYEMQSLQQLKKFNVRNLEGWVRLLVINIIR